jgi:flagellar hook-basal body complex protein FliE
MNVNSLDQLKAALEAAANRQSTPAPQATTPGADFGSALDDALNEVSRLQTKSADLQKAFQSGDSAVSLEQTMVAMQKSQVAFQAAVTVRNRLVSAYTEIMNMQV